LLLLTIPARLYADSGSWIDGDLPVLHVGQPTTPASLSDCFNTNFIYYSYTKPNGTFDSIGRTVTQPVCATQNLLGFYGSTGDGTGGYDFVKPNTSTAFRVLTQNGRLGAVFPVPNQSTFITKDSTNSFFGEVAPHFYDDFPSAGTFGPFSYGSGFSTQE